MSIVSSPTKATTETSNGENLPQLISPKTMAYIHSVLQERPLFLYFENDIESRFYAKRAEEYRRLVSVGKLIFFILFGLISTTAIKIFPLAVMADDQFVLKYVLAPIGGLLFLVMMLADKPFFQTNYQWLATPVSTIILSCVMMASLTTIDSNFAQHAAYDVMIIVIIISFGLRVQFPVCLLIICLAAVMTILATVSLNWKIDSSNKER